MTELTTHTMTGQAAEVLRALHNAALFAGTDATMPVLCQVHFRVIDGTQVAEGTDRRGVGQAMIRSADPAAGTLEGVLLSAKDLQRAVKSFRKVLRAEREQRRIAGSATITITVPYGADHAELTLAVPSRTPVTEKAGRFTGEGTWPAAAADKLWKQHGKRLAKLDGHPWSRRHVFRADTLARLAGVEGDSGSFYGDNVQLQFTTTGQTVYAEIGTEFRALVMPVNEGWSLAGKAG